MLLILLFLFLLFCSRPSETIVDAAAAHCTTFTTTTTYNKCMNLPSQQASIAWTYHPHNGTLELAFFGTFISPSGWVAWGINPSSPAMTGARVLAAFSDPSSGGLVVLPYILDPATKLRRSPLTSRQLDVPLLPSSASLDGGGVHRVADGSTVQIHVTLELVPNKTTVHHVWNRGLYVQGYSPTVHPTSSSDLASHATFDVISSAATAAPAPASDWLRPLHAILNAISWGICLPTGVTIARYLRHYESVGPTWFYVHVSVQITGFLLGTVGFATGIVLGRASPGVSYPVHRSLGVAVFCMGSWQSLALLFRPKMADKCRKYWKSYHHLVGYGCVVVGVVNVFQGFEVMGLDGSYAKLGYCLFLSALIGVCASLEVNSWVMFCRKSKEEAMRKEGLVGEVGGGGNVKSSDR